MGKTLYEHAKFELEKLDLLSEGDEANRKVYETTLALVKRFEKQGHNQFTGKWVLEFFETLCNFLPLSPLTDDPAEWTEYQDTRRNMATGEEETITRWQNNRAPMFMSEDGGKTFTDLRTDKKGESVDHVKQAEEWAAARSARKAAREQELAPKQPEQVTAPKPAAPDNSTPAGEEVN